MLLILVFMMYAKKWVLSLAWPYLESLKKEGEHGRRKINQYTRYLTFAVSIMQGLGFAVLAEKYTEKLWNRASRIGDLPHAGAPRPQ